MPAGAELAEKLQLAAGTPIYQLKRIHLIDRRPMSVAVSYVVVTAIANVDEIGISLYDYFRRNKVEMGSLRSQVSAAMADDDIRQALRLSEPMPLLIVRQTLFDHHKSRSNTAKASAAATCTSLPAKADPLRHAVAYASPCRRRRNARTPERKPRYPADSPVLTPPAIRVRSLLRRAARRKSRWPSRRWCRCHRPGWRTARRTGSDRFAPAAPSPAPRAPTRWCSPRRRSADTPVRRPARCQRLHPPPETPVRCAPPAKG